MYFTTSELETFTGKDFSTAEETQLTNVIIPAVQLVIENFTGRKFNVGSDANSTRYYFGQITNRNDYDPYGKGLLSSDRTMELEIDEFVSITSISEVDSDGNVTALTVSDFELAPLNTEYKNKLIALKGGFHAYKYKVVGKLGTSATVPADIKLAAMQIAAEVVADTNNLSSETIEGYSYTTRAQQVMQNNPSILTTMAFWRRILV